MARFKTVQLKAHVLRYTRKQAFRRRNIIAKRLAIGFRRRVRAEGKYGFFRSMSRTITAKFDSASDITAYYYFIRWEVVIAHVGAFVKEYGAYGTNAPVAGQGRYSKPSKYSRSGGKAKWLPIPVGHTRGKRYRKTSDYGAGELQWRAPKGVPRSQWGTGNFGGTLVKKTRGRGVRTIFALFKRVELPPHNSHLPLGKRRGYLPSRHWIRFMIEEGLKGVL